MPTRNGRKCKCSNSLAGDLLQANGGSWPFQTNTNLDYAAGFYGFAGAADDFSPAINFGAANEAKAAHISLVTGAITVGEVQVTVGGTSNTDAGVRTGSDSEIIIIPDGTPANTYFETSKKWSGTVSLETTSGTAISCNYFWSKYHDFANTNFTLGSLEALWSSDAVDSGADVELLHHKAIGWTYNAGGAPSTPAPIAQRSVDLGAENNHTNGGVGSWKRTNLSTLVLGSESEGFLFRITSGSTGQGAQSFKTLSLEIGLRQA
jgi:hypothetical protein